MNHRKDSAPRRRPVTTRRHDIVGDEGTAGLRRLSLCGYFSKNELAGLHVSQELRLRRSRTERFVRLPESTLYLSRLQMDSGMQTNAQTFADSVCNSKRTPYGRTRRVIVPGIAAILIVWLVQSGLDPRTTNPAWILRVRIPFTNIFPLLHWDLIVSFAIVGALSALYGAFVVFSSPKQRYFGLLFPIFFEVLKWFWLIRFPLAPWIDPAHPPYRFDTLPLASSIGYWVIHIVIPAAAALGVLYLFNRLFYSKRERNGMDPAATW
jgi:hypothetical protein